MSIQINLLWYLSNIWDYFVQMLPCMLIALMLFLVLTPLRKARLANRELVSPACREAALLLFVMFGAGLAALTLFPADFWSVSHWRSFLQGDQSLFPAVDRARQLQNLQLVPGREIQRAFRGPWVMFLLLANIGMFVPVGFFSALLWRRARWWKSLLVGFFLSCSIEGIQFFIGRTTDIDDVILNTAGALGGFWLFWLLHAVVPKGMARFQCRERKDVQDG
jgi:glycopeptide antibiotics resistance protein